jgi:hypothetical protein
MAHIRLRWWLVGWAERKTEDAVRLNETLALLAEIERSSRKESDPKGPAEVASEKANNGRAAYAIRGTIKIGAAQ